ncbi:response regulator [Desulfocicer niacini]
MIQYKFLMFIAGQSSNATRAINNFKRICKSKLHNNYELNIIDVTENSRLAEEQRIVASPTLIMISPTPAIRIIGDFSDANQVISSLGLYPSDIQKGDKDIKPAQNRHPSRQDILKILLFEDDPDDVVLLKETFKSDGFAAIDLTAVKTLSDGMKFLDKQTVDIILLDLHLPDSNGLDTFRALQKIVNHIPVIILSGLSDEKIALDSLREGAQDYLVKGQIDGNLLRRSIRYAIERMKIKKELKESQDKTALLIEKHTDGILLMDKNGVIRFANPAAEQLLGASSEKLIGSQFAFSVSEKKPVEIELIRQGRITKTVELSATWVKMNNHSLYLASLRDITARRKTEQKNLELIVRNEKIKASEALLKIKTQALKQESMFKSQFLANMSHELRSPLNSIILLSEGMYENQENALPPQMVKYAKIIYKSGKELLELINEILSFSKLDAGKMTVSFSKIQLQEWARNLDIAYGELAAKKGLAFNVSMDQSLPQQITTDHQKLGQIIRNLVSNALKFTPNGSIKVMIHRPNVKADLEKMPWINSKKYIAISVIDTGIGIAEEDQDFIFQAFRQIDGSTSREYEGSGLGLSISRKLADLLQGNLVIKSKPQNGSRFTLYIPETVDMPENQETEPPTSRKQSLVKISKNFSERFAGTRVLLVDDDMRNLYGMAKILEDYKIHVEKSTSGLKALQMIKAASSVDIILMDIMMPTMDGYELIRNLKTARESKHIPIIAVSAMTHETDLIKCFQAGIDGYVSKPVDIHTLLKEMDKLMYKGDTK